MNAIHMLLVCTFQVTYCKALTEMAATDTVQTKLDDV